MFITTAQLKKFNIFDSVETLLERRSFLYRLLIEKEFMAPF